MRLFQSGDISRPEIHACDTGQSASQTRPGSSGDPHFHAQHGSSLVRSPAFSCSIRLKLGTEPRIFTLDRGTQSGAGAHLSLCRGTYLPKFGLSTPPPPPRIPTHLLPFPVLRLVTNWRPNCCKLIVLPLSFRVSSTSIPTWGAERRWFVPSSMKMWWGHVVSWEPDGH